VKRFPPDWADNSHALALGAELKEEALSFHLILNAYWEPLTFEFPKPAGDDSWKRWIDTGLDWPNDIVPWKSAPAVSGNSYRAEARSAVMLIREH
jgi:isoamylase